MPALLYPAAKFLYRWWIMWEIYYKELNWMLFEIVPPSEVVKPFRAMEDVIHSLWPIYDKANWREEWCMGELPLGPYWWSFEIASFGGEIHFYIRLEEKLRNFFESVLHAHYPEAEVFEVPDYTQNVPQNMPNESLDFYGEDYRFMKNDAYPIRTYKFFEIKPEEVYEEKRLDPLSALLERMTKLKKDEQAWFQIVLVPITDRDIPWATKGRAIADKIARRPAKPKRSIIGEAARSLAFGKTPFEEEKKEEPVIPPEMKLTPGEREILQGIEDKIAKQGFKTSMRFIYVHKKGAYFSPYSKIVRSYFMHFGTQNLNVILYLPQTRTRVHFLFRQRRLFARKKDMFRKYVKRFPPCYPKVVGPGTLIFNAEEIASIFHLPMKAATLPPGVPRILAKKGGPPPGIPTGPPPDLPTE